MEKYARVLLHGLAEETVRNWATKYGIVLADKAELIDNEKVIRIIGELPKEIKFHYDDCGMWADLTVGEDENRVVIGVLHHDEESGTGNDDKYCISLG